MPLIQDRFPLLFRELTRLAPPVTAQDRACDLPLIFQLNAPSSTGSQTSGHLFPPLDLVINPEPPSLLSSPISGLCPETSQFAFEAPHGHLCRSPLQNKVNGISVSIPPLPFFPEMKGDFPSAHFIDMYEDRGLVLFPPPPRDLSAPRGPGVGNNIMVGIDDSLPPSIPFSFPFSTLQRQPHPIVRSSAHCSPLPSSPAPVSVMPLFSPSRKESFW